VLDELLGYHVEDHLVNIVYYRPRGDAKEAWDNIDLSGFLGQRMQLKVNFLCRDSILAAPLVLEIARVLDAAHTARGGRGRRAAGSVLQGADDRVPVGAGEHALHLQDAALRAWLAAGAS
jgi:myo-inositol-1-phosphate synthase